MSTFFSKPRNPGDVKETSAAPSPETAAEGGESELEAPFVRPGAGPQTAAPQGAAPQSGAPRTAAPEGATSQSAATGTVTAPAVAAAGVVPPAAAPLYSVPSAGALPRSMPPAGAVPHSVPPAGAIPRVRRVAENPGTESVRMANETQQRVQVAAQRARTASSPARAGRRLAQQGVLATPSVARPRPRQAFDPAAYAQAGLLKLAWNWQQAGAPIRAIHTYMQLLTRYPGTPAAAAAVADLVEFADVLAEQGQFHTALRIYDQLEELT